MYKIELDKLKIKALTAENSNKTFFKKLKKNQLKELDNTIQEIHEEVFEEINCLDCANCCKTLGPRITIKDIEKLSSYLKMKQSDFVDKYLRIDEDKDFVFKNMPCPFLMPDNYCSVYPERPKACREYPHTDRKKFYQIYSLTIKNSTTCPAVYEILEELKRQM